MKRTQAVCARIALALAVALTALFAVPGTSSAGQRAGQISDVEPGSASGVAGPITGAGPYAYFAGSSQGTGTEPYRTDGTGAGTIRLADIDPAGDSSPTDFTDVAGTVFFAADSPGEGVELWKSDGTPGGTVLVADINPTGNSHPDELTAFGGLLYFAADNGVDGTELWKSDGTAAGTEMVEDIEVGGSSSPSFFANIGGKLLFRATRSAEGAELWKTDGTPVGTDIVKNIEPGAGGSSPSKPVDFNGSAFFAATTTADGTELWKSNGTGPGTTIVSGNAIAPGAASSAPAEMTKVGGRLVFEATNAGTGSELWRAGADGMVAQVTDLNPGPTGSLPDDLTELNGQIYFSADDGSTGRELWKTDGTAVNTAQVKDITAGAGGTAVGELTPLDGLLYFAAQDPALNTELFRSDGTTAGTVLAADLVPGAAAGGPHFLAALNHDLVFAADDGVHGSELWGGQAAVTASAPSLAFASTEAGATSASMRLTLTSDGISPLHVSDIRTTGADALDFEVQAENCVGDELLFGEVCLVDVVFDPETVGAKTANLKIASDDSDSPLQVPLTGTATTPTPPPPPPDTTAPDVFFTSGPAGLSNDSTPTFGFAMSEAGALECRTDGAQYAACSSPSTTAALSDGPHSFEVRATDTAGNRSSVSRQLLVDTTAPQTVLAAPANPVTTQRKRAKVSLSFSASEPGSTFRCSLDGRAFGHCVSPQALSLKVGTHTFAVRATDRVANADASPAMTTFEVKKQKR